MKYKTHQTEHNFVHCSTFVKTTSVRSSQTAKLKHLVLSAQRNQLPDGVIFDKMPSGFIPPQYDRSNITERFNRMNSLAEEIDEIKQRKAAPKAEKQEPEEGGTTNT